MRDAVIVSTARTPLTKAARGAFNNTTSPTLGAYSVRAAVERAGIEGGEVDDVVIGAAMQQGSQSPNIGRLVALRAGLPVTVPAMSIDRQCSSGLMTIATAAKQVVIDRMDICVAGGVESISKIRGDKLFIEPDQELLKMHSATYMPMIGTAEVVARRYNISRERQDEYSLQSQQRTAAAQAAGKFDDEIVACTATMAVVNKETKEVTYQEVTATRDDCNRPDTTLEGLANLQPVMGEGHTITAGNASQLSDGSSACVVMEAKVAEKRGLKPLARIVAHAMHAQEPNWFTTAPVGATQKALAKAGWQARDVDLWEVNEAFAAVTMAAMAEFKLPHEIVNVHGGACALGHPIGASGARIMVTLIHALQRRGLQKGLATLCIGGGEGTAVALELI